MWNNGMGPWKWRWVNVERGSYSKAQVIIMVHITHTLDCGRISLQSNNFSNKVVMTNTNKFIHGSPTHSICDNDWSWYLMNFMEMIEWNTKPCDSGKILLTVFKILENLYDHKY